MPQNRYHLFLAMRTPTPLTEQSDIVFCSLRENHEPIYIETFNYARDAENLATRVVERYISDLEANFGRKFTHKDLHMLTRFVIVDAGLPDLPEIRTDNYVFTEFAQFPIEETMKFNRTVTNTLLERLCPKVNNAIEDLEV